MIAHLSAESIRTLLLNLSVLMQVRTITFQPRTSLIYIVTDTGHLCPEPGAVIVLNKMCNFMGHHVIQHPIRGHDQSPGKIQIPFMGTRSPTRTCIAYGYASVLCAKGFGFYPCALGYFPPGLRLHPIPQTPCQMLRFPGYH